MTQYNLAPLGAIIKALHDNNCELIDILNNGSLKFIGYVETQKETLTLITNEVNNKTIYEILEANNNHVKYNSLQQNLNNSIENRLLAFNNYDNYHIIALRKIETLGFNVNEQGELFRVDNRNFIKKIADHLKPQHPSFITNIIIAINIIIFIAMAIASAGNAIMEPESELLINWGANYLPLINLGQYWRLFTCMFLHIGIMHLTVNMYSLFSLGEAVEHIFGKKLYILAYITSGLIASILSLWYNGINVSAGASGALFGLIGLLIAIACTNIFAKEHKAGILKNLLITVAINIGIGFSSSRIDNAAHIGGLIAGLIIGLICYRAIKSNFTKKFVNMAYVGISLTLVIFSLLLITIFNHYKKYDAIVQPYFKSTEKLKGNFNTDEALEEYIDKEFTPIANNTILKLNNNNFYYGLNKSKAQQIELIERHKKILFFAIAIDKNPTDIKLKDSLNYYKNKNL
jgi:membrane associated rhomboid family serine protease